MSAKPPVHLVRRADELPDETWDEVAGGTTWRTLFALERTGTTGMTSGVAVVPVGGHWPAHRHPVAESYFYLAGVGRMQVGAEVHDVGAGSAVMVPHGEPHGVVNTGAEPLRFFYVFPVDSPSDVVYTFDRPTDRPTDRLTD